MASSGYFSKAPCQAVSLPALCECTRNAIINIKSDNICMITRGQRSDTDNDIENSLIMR